jgi:fucose permease
VGYVLGPVAMGLIVDRSGPVAAILVSAALLVTIGLAFAIAAPETHPGGGSN